jgi:hypothetical protein
MVVTNPTMLRDVRSSPQDLGNTTVVQRLLFWT